LAEAYAEITQKSPESKKTPYGTDPFKKNPPVLLIDRLFGKIVI
jgi:hypothetical protein